jgi:ketosteroid isomerase-like protein
MDTIMFTRRFVRIVVVSFAIAAVACGRSSPLQQDTNVASEPTAAWVAAFNAGDPAALAALYAEDARSLPPGGPPVAGRSQIESYWRDDLGEGGVTTLLTPVDAVTQADLVHVEGTYQVKGKDGAELAIAREDASMSAHQCGGFGRPGSVVHAAAEHHRIVAINV